MMEENTITVTNVILPEKYTKDMLMDLYRNAQKKVNKKAQHIREHFSGFSYAYSIVTVIIFVLHLFIREGFIEASYRFLLGNNFFIWLPCYLFLTRIDKVFSFICRKIGIYTDNPYCDKVFFHLIGFYMFAKQLKENPQVPYDTIKYSIMDGETKLVEFGGLYAAVDGENDFRWLDREVDKFVKKAK